MAVFVRPQRKKHIVFFQCRRKQKQKGEREREREKERREERKERDTVSTAKKEITRWFEKEQIGG